MKYSRMLLVFLSLLAVSFVVHYIIFVRGYGEGYGYDSISNALFLVGVATFFPSLLAQLGSYRFFYGIQYALRGMISNEFRSRYRNFSDYLNEKTTKIITTIYTEVMLASGTVLASAIVLAMLWGREL